MHTKTSSPDRLENVICLKDSGLFHDALKALEAAPRDFTSRLSAQVLRGELLERVGRRREAEATINRALSSKALAPDDRSLCDFVLARIRIEHGDYDTAITHLNKCISIARRCGNLERVGFAQLKMFTILSDGVGTDATGPLLAEIRANAIRSGSPTLLCAVHVYFAQIEALRGLVNSSQRHIRLALRVLQDAPNLWLESVIENIRLALAILSSRLDVAELHAKRGASLAERTGGAAEYAVNRGNSGFLHYMRGNFSEAIDCYECTLRLAVPGSQNHSGTLDSLARVKLAQGQFDECESYLLNIEQAAIKPRDRQTYVYRHAQLTRAHVALRRGNIESARSYIADVLQLAKQANDRLLEVAAQIASAETEVRRHNLDAAWNSIVRITNDLLDVPADISGSFERLMATACGVFGDCASAGDHVERAARVFSSLYNVRALSELNNDEKLARNPTERTRPAPAVASSVLQSVALILNHARHPELIARELVFVLSSTGCVKAAKAISLSKDGDERVLCGFGPNRVGDTSTVKRIAVGATIERSIELIVEPTADIEALATIQAAAQLMTFATTLRIAKDDQNEKTTIWQDETLPIDGKTVISGHMREQMTFAQRVARTTVTVLITGESGTGKEILARAIHDFSDRAQKPFVPLNCAAVPRELLESQLFGHRRGAFTGAERDHLGVIRGAAGGTLLLDEVGEMSLELQPKLLRFLESGEISPLGEPSPLTVNVRVIAATNTNLEDAVRDGRFREDLFYRLNVVRLSLRPLRERRDEIPGLVTHFVDAAAREYKKGHLEVAEETLERLLLYRWPGNIRQLHNEIRRMVALAEPNSTLQPDAISIDILRSMPHLRHAVMNGHEIAVPLQEKLLPTLSRIEYEMIKAALRENHGRLEPAAKALGISRKGLYLKRQRLGL